MLCSADTQAMSLQEFELNSYTGRALLGDSGPRDGLVTQTLDRLASWLPGLDTLNPR